MPILHKQTVLSKKEKQQLKAYLAEMRSRGLEIPEEIKQKIRKTEVAWPVSKEGYLIKNTGLLYNASEAQASFIANKSRFSLFVGGRGSGKSAAGAQKALHKIMEGQSGAIYNPDFENFKVSTWPEFKDWIPWQHIVPAHQYRAKEEYDPSRPFSLVFNNGARVYCKGLKDPGSARGPNINWLWYDEAGRDHDGMSWKVAIASVRIGTNPQAWCTATGRGKSHWMYEFFVEQNFPPDIQGVIDDLLKDYPDDINLIDWFKGSIEDNKDNLDPFFYASMLASYPAGYLREQELYGEFADEGGALGDASWFNGKIVPAPPKTVKSRVRYWDLAASEVKIVRGKKRTDPDETVGTLLSHVPTEDIQDDFYIEHQRSGQWEWDDIIKNIVEVAEMDGAFVPIYIEQEPAAGGKNQVAAIKKEVNAVLPAWTVHGHRPEGDKVIRANIWFGEAANGHFRMVQGNWNDGFLKQLSSFPHGRHDDKIDSVSGARICCAPLRKWKHIDFLSL